MPTLLEQAIREDRHLEDAVNRSRMDLAYHRWHWTLDKQNPRRVTMSEYAKLLNRNQRTVVDMVNGYVDWREARVAPDALGEFLALAKLRGDTKEATVAVAEAKGIGVESARRHHAGEIRSVKATAQERAERKGTSVAQEVRSVAAKRQEHAAQTKQTKTEAARRKDFRLISIEGKVASAMRYLRSALDESEDVPLTDDERQEVADMVGRLKAVANLLEVRLVGSTDVDWDKEMAKLVGG